MKISIDLGGHTMMAAGISEVGDGELLAIRKSVSLNTPLSRGVPDVMGAVAGVISELSGGDGVSGIGIAVPGMIDADRRHARTLPNFPTEWTDLDIVESLGSVIEAGGSSIPIKIENDANCYALGEGTAGLAVGIKDYVVLTLGTGIGCGIVVNGQLLTGAHGMAGEAGHLVVIGSEPCRCGGSGHVETLAGADATARRAKAAGLPEDFRELWAMPRGQGVSKILSVTIDALARAVASISHMLDPELIILGGGMSQAVGIAEIIHDASLQYMSNPFKKNLNIKVSELGNKAALYGAASLF